MEGRAKNELHLTDRRNLVLQGVEQVGSFDEKEIVLGTNMGVLLIRGEDLHITQLNLETGQLVVEGFITSIQFMEDKSVKGGKVKGRGVLQRLLK